MDVQAHPALSRLLARAADDPDVLAVILFGSRARDEATRASDVDVCLVLQPGAAAEPGASHKHLTYLALGDLDVVVFQQLPLVMRSRVLKEGRVLHVRDEDALYDLAFRTMKAWDDFKYVHRMYLDEVARG